VRRLLLTIVALLLLGGCGMSRSQFDFTRGLVNADRLADDGAFDRASDAYDALAWKADRVDLLRYVQFRRALMDEHRGRLAEARAAYLRIAASPTSVYDDDAGEALYRMALIAREKEKDEVEAARWFERMLLSYPNTSFAPDAFDAMVERLRGQGDHAGALRLAEGIYTRLRDTEVADDALYRIARISDEDLHDPEQALGRYLELTLRFPRSSFTDDAAWRAAACYGRLGNTNMEYGTLEAMLDEREVSWIMADYESRYYVPALLRMAVIREQQGRLLDAVAVLHRFRDTYDLSLKRDDTGFDIVRLLLAAGQRDEAAAMVTELRETFPDSRFTRKAQALLTGEGLP
jgi:TolA-binding protein